MESAENPAFGKFIPETFNTCSRACNPVDGASFGAFGRMTTFETCKMECEGMGEGWNMIDFESRPKSFGSGCNLDGKKVWSA